MIATLCPLIDPAGSTLPPRPGWQSFVGLSRSDGLGQAPYLTAREGLMPLNMVSKSGRVVGLWNSTTVTSLCRRCFRCCTGSGCLTPDVNRPPGGRPIVLQRLCTVVFSRLRAGQCFLLVLSVQPIMPINTRYDGGSSTGSRSSGQAEFDAGSIPHACDQHISWPLRRPFCGQFICFRVLTSPRCWPYSPESRKLKCLTWDIVRHFAHNGYFPLNQLKCTVNQTNRNRAKT